MSRFIKDNQWVWVVIQDPGKHEKLLGQRDEDLGISFIPVFLDKEAAQDSFLHIPKEKNQKYEIQAIIHGDLLQYALKNGFMLFILDSDGKILKKIDPAGR